MFETATTTAHRDAIARAHSERAAVFAAGITWLRGLFAPKSDAPAASAAQPV
ncbi:MAG: hypothetical protein AAFO93_11105 [Pseudomonadota bacterium]